MSLNDTPQSDQLEASRIALGQDRTPAYGDALALCRKLERQLNVYRDHDMDSVFDSFPDDYEV